jgi:hypothetical protein
MNTLSSVSKQSGAVHHEKGATETSFHQSFTLALLVAMCTPRAAYDELLRTLCRTTKKVHKRRDLLCSFVTASAPPSLFAYLMSITYAHIKYIPCRSMPPDSKALRPNLYEAEAQVRRSR